ncbi:MAG TPA: ankyrin repeat domain-containing protein, partial [Candidatus Acidoferrales bacterium]|nr:ankyrin repeat domain-containing protein [Candidatus Acidoferrales bacterium]
MSDSVREPSAPTFERARALARQLTRDCRARDASALKRVQAQLPRLAALDPPAAAASVRLADVQHALAREAGLESWAALKHLLQSREPLARQIERFLFALVAGRPEAMRSLLERFPGIAGANLHFACAACDPDAAERWLVRDPAGATAPLNGHGWRPLDCLAASPLFSLDDAHRAASVAIGERLLALGADPNTSSRGDGEGEGPLSALFRASQVGNTGLVRLLLERGANPNDGESVYHAAEHGHRAVLELLLAHGAEISACQQPWNNTVLYFLTGHQDEHALAGPSLVGMRWLLEHGADPNVGSYEHRETPLHRVADTGRSAAVAELLLEFGADPHAARADGRTPYELAMRSGNAPVAALLRARGGAVGALRPDDAFLAACARGDEPGARAIRAAHPELSAGMIDGGRSALMRAARAGNVPAVRTLAALGFDLAEEGPWGGTPLHWSAWHGKVAMVRELLA